MLSSCSKSNDLTAIDFVEVEIWTQGTPITCREFDNIQQRWSIQQLAFFISDIHFNNENKKEKADLMINDWQTNDIALIQPPMLDCNAENKTLGNEDVTNTYPPDSIKTNSQLRFSVPVDVQHANEMSFTLGIPFESNHQNPLSQPSPLNLPNMFWSWRSGHKFFRLDAETDDQSWVFHLGSVGCEAASTMRSPKTECIQPNRVNFQLKKMMQGTKLILDLDKLFAGVSLQNGNSCLFHGEQKSCEVLMSNLKTKNVFEWH